MFTTIYNYLQSFTSIYNYLQLFTINFNYLQLFTIIHNSLSPRLHFGRRTLFTTEIIFPVSHLLTMTDQFQSHSQGLFSLD